MIREEAFEYARRIRNKTKDASVIVLDGECIDAILSNPWHKASEELPEVPEKKKYVKVLTTLHHGSGYDFRILYFHKDFGFSTHKEYQNAYYKDRKAGCAHWMYIPEIKEG